MAKLPSSLRRPDHDYAHSYDYVNLGGDWDSFHLPESLGGPDSENEDVYYGRGVPDREDQALYQTKDGRWVLLFILMPGHEDEAGPVDRELTPRQAARWLRLCRIRPPHGLAPAPSFHDDTIERQNGQNRLDRDWSPPTRHDAKSIPGQTSAGSEVGGDISTLPAGDASTFQEPQCSVQSPEAENPRPVVLHGRKANPVVYGITKPLLSPGQYEVVSTLLDAKVPLKSIELSRRSKHTDARKILERLAASDPGWEAAIIMSGKARCGYSIRS